MEQNLGDLLEELDNAPHGSILTVDDLIKKWSHPDVTQKLLNEAWKRELIADKYYPLRNEPYTTETAPPNTALILTIKGFELLNQIRIKKAIEKFNESSDKSYEKIIDLTGKLGLSVEKLSTSTEQLSKSSKRLEDFTVILIAITVFLAVIPLIELLKDFLPKFGVVILAFTLLLFMFYIIYFLYKNYRG